MSALFESLRRGPTLVLGRAGMDIYADPPGETAETAERFVACLGGSAGNIAAGLGRAGHRTELVSCVSDDAVGRFVINQLAQYGVGVAHVRTVKGEARTSFAVTETRLVDTQTVIYRNGAADLLIDQAQVDGIDVARYGALIVTGTALATEPSRSASLALMRRMADAGGIVILDLDYRPYSWTSPGEVERVYRSAGETSHMVVGNDEEFAVMAGGGDGEALAKALAAEGRIAIYKLGAEGSRTHTAEGMIETGIFPVEAIKPMGAGDAFMAGLVAALADSGTLAEGVRRGSAAAAMVVSAIGCAPAMPTASALDGFISSRGGAAGA